MNKSLYNIKNEYLELAEALVSNGGELTEGLENALAINRQELEQKSSNYGLLIRDMKGREDLIDAEIKRLSELKTSFSKTRQRLEENILNAMVDFGVNKIEGDLIHLAVHKNPDSLEIENEDLIPKKFKTEKTVITPDKKAIKAQLQNGHLVLGAKLITDKKRLKIK